MGVPGQIKMCWFLWFGLLRYQRIFQIYIFFIFISAFESKYFQLMIWSINGPL